MVMGRAMTELPKDLYIPPDALEVILEAFEGPLDLLLYLIRRQNIDILDIPIAEISRQYVQYIELMKELNQQEGTTFIFSTHDQRVMDRADRIVMLTSWPQPARWRRAVHRPPRPASGRGPACG